MLSGDKKGEFLKIAKMVAAYDASLKEAEKTFRKAYADLGGDPAMGVPYTGGRADQLAYRVPGMGQDEQTKVRELARDFNMKLYKDVAAEIKARGISMPRGRPGSDAVKNYSNARREVMDELYAQRKDELMKKLEDAMGAESKAKFVKLQVASEEYGQKQSQSMEKLEKGLKDLIGVERMKLPTRASMMERMKNMRGVRGAGARMHSQGGQ